jgi:hypothetical protein
MRICLEQWLEKKRKMIIFTKKNQLISHFQEGVEGMEIR